ncbi:phage portal protein [bacterium]|nr:phage portal protein [bacterium]
MSFAEIIKGGVDAALNILKASSLKDPDSERGMDGCWHWPLDYRTLATLPELSSWHARCLEVTAAAAVGVGYDFQTDDPDEKEQARETLEEMAGADTFADVTAFWLMSELATGNGYLEVTRDGESRPAELFTALPQFMYRTLDKRGWKYRPDGMTKNVSALRNYGLAATSDIGNELLHLRRLNLKSTVYGVPRWLACLTAIQLDEAAKAHNVNFFENGMMMDFVMAIIGGGLDADHKKSAKSFLKKETKGVDNAHRGLYIELDNPEAKLQIEKLGESLRDGSFHNLRMDNRDEIIAAHGVPPRILGIMSAGSLGGGGEVVGQLMVFDQVTLQPAREQVAKLLNKTIIKDLGLPPIVFNPLDYSDMETDAKALAMLVGAKIISREEARGKAGYEGDVPEDEGDEDDDLTKQLERIERELEKAA